MAIDASVHHHGGMQMGRFGLVLLMMGVTAAATYVGTVIAGVGGAVIGAASGVAVSSLGEAGRQWLDSRDKRRQLRERVFLPLSHGIPPESAPTPATLLVAERAIVPFIGRAREISELADWCSRWNRDPLRLLVGAGGSGKTRLAREVAERLIGWDCNWIRTGEEADALRAAGHRKSLVVVDYAETKPRENLGRLVRNLAWPPDRKNVRVLLIARTDGDWWSELIEKADTVQERFILGRTVHMKLDSIPEGNNAVEQYYRTAVEAFSNTLDRPMNEIRIPEFSKDATILVVHISALLDVLGSDRLSSGQYEQLLDHEDRYWQRSAESCGFTHFSRKARRESVAELVLSGADNIADLAEQLKRIPDLAGTPIATRRAVAQWLQDLYPAEGLDRVGSFRPHLLAEHLVVQELAADGEFLNRALKHLPEKNAHHALTVLGYASGHDQRAIRMIAESVMVNPGRMILPAVSAAVETGARIDAMLASQVATSFLDTQRLAQVSAAIPWKSNSLDRTATVVRNKFIEAATAELGRNAKRATNPTAVNRRQTELMEYVRVSRQQGRILPAQVRRQLITALKNQEKTLAHLGELQEAHKISRQIEWVESQVL
jgi:hypothetical protein